MRETILFFRKTILISISITALIDWTAEFILDKSTSLSIILHKTLTFMNWGFVLTLGTDGNIAHLPGPLLIKFNILTLFSDLIGDFLHLNEAHFSKIPIDLLSVILIIFNTCLEIVNLAFQSTPSNVIHAVPTVTNEFLRTSPPKHTIPLSHSLYNLVEGHDSNLSSSSDDEEMLYLESSNKVLKRFYAYSERLKTSSVTSFDDDGLEERMIESRRSFLEIRDLDMSEWRRNGMHMEFRITYSMKNERMKTFRTQHEFLNLYEDFRSFYDGICFPSLFEGDALNNPEKAMVLNFQFLKFILEKQLNTIFFRNFLRPKNQLQVYNKEKTSILSPLWRKHSQNKTFGSPPPPKNQEVQLPERSQSFVSIEKCPYIQSLILSDKEDTIITIMGSFLRERFDDKRENIYEINVARANGKISTVIYKRFNDFNRLHKRLETEYSNVELPRLPLINQQNTEGFRGELEEFLQKSICNPQLKNSEALRDFLDLRNVF